MFLGRSAPDGQNAPVKFSQRIQITVPGGNTTGTGTISQSVQVNKSVVTFNGIEDEDGYTGAITEGAAYFSSISSGASSQITAIFNSTTTHDRIVDVEVTEWYPWAVKLVQHGTITIGSGTTTVDGLLGTTVNVNYSSVIHCGQTSTSTSQNVNRTNCTAVLGALGDRVSATRINSTDSLTLYYAAIEFHPQVIKSRQQVSITFSSSSIASSTASISSVDPNYTLLLWGGCTHSGFQDRMLDVDLTSGTQLTATQGGSAVVDNTRIAVVTALEFNKRYVKSKNSARSATGTGTNVANTTITAVALARMFFSRTGFSTTNAFSNSNLGYMRSGLTSTTNVQSKRQTSGFSTDSTSAWNAMEFYG